MAIWDICIRRPIFTLMIMLAPIVLGIASYFRLGIDLFPNVDLPLVVVTTTLKGASVEEMETSVTRLIEEAVNSVAGIEEMRSTTREGVSQVVIGFVLEKNGDIAAQEVRDKISAILPQLPLGTDPPVVEKFDIGTTPIMTIAVAGKRPLQEVTEIAKKQVKDNLETVLGVGSAVVVGGRQRALNIIIDTDKLSSLDLSIDDVRSALIRQNVELPGGRVDLGSRELVLRTMGRMQSPSEFTELIIVNRNGYPIRIADIGRVEDTFEEPRGLARFDGNNSVSVVVQKQSGSNTIAVADRIRERLEKIKQILPADIECFIERDQSTFIRRSIDEVKFHLLLAAILVSGTIYLFIRDWRTTVIASLAIPASMVATFSFMQYMEFTLNNITLLAMILAVGIVVDDAVVVHENIFRHMEEYGTSSAEAASRATREIALAVVATTLSLLVIFLPVAFMSGRVGRFFNCFGFVVAFSIFMSMCVSFTLTPMMCAHFLKPPTHPETNRPQRSSIARSFLRIFSFLPTMIAGWAIRRGLVRSVSTSHSSKTGFIWQIMSGTYLATLEWSLRHRWLVMLGTAGVFLSTPFIFLAVGKDFVPRDDQGEYEVMISFPEGYSLEKSNQVISEIEARIRAMPETVNVLTTIGETNGRAARGNGDVTRGSIYVRIPELGTRPYTQFDVQKRARAILDDYPDLRTTVQDVKQIQTRGFKDVQLEVSLRGPDLDRLQEYANQLSQWMRQQNGKFIDVDTSLSLRNPELRVLINREKASDLGIQAQSIASTLNILIGGEIVTKYKERDEQYDVWLRADREFRSNPEVIGTLTIPSSKAGLVHLNNIAKLELARGPSSIDRYGRQRQVLVYANLDGLSLGDAVNQVTQYIQELNLPPQYTYEFLGEAKLLAETNTNFLLAFVLAFIFMYMILAAQFESLVHPITILLSLPLTLPFALLSLLILNTSLDIYSTIGLFMLFGIVKKNGILQVDYTNVLRSRGRSVYEAIIEANETRLRPILMTTFMLVAAMIPIALGEGPGASSRASMAKVILGGQLLSLLLTLLVVPVAYSLWVDFESWFKRQRQRVEHRRPKPVEEPVTVSST